MRSHRLSKLALALGLSLALVACSDDNDDDVDPITDPITDVGGGSDNDFLPPEIPSGYTVKEISFADNNMVAAANPVAVQAGVDVLANGGKAIDAAIAVQAVLNLVEPQSSGIGGGAFIVYYDAATKSLTTYDARETAPAATTPERFLDEEGNTLGFSDAVGGGLSVGTPGVLRGLEMAHTAHGALPWAGLFDRAIQLSEDGFEISNRMSTSVAGSAERLAAQPAAAAYFLQEDGTAKPTGTVQTNPEFAATLRTVAEQGADAFYTGPLAQAMVDIVNNHPTNPGDLSLEDLAGYTAIEREPVCVVYRTDYRVCGMGPPSSGALTVGMTLKMLERFDLAATGPNTAESNHLILEAYKLAYADRGAYMADSDFVDVPVDGLIDSAYLDTRSALIEASMAMDSPDAGFPPGVTVAMGQDNSLQLPSTSHISIVDSEGNSVSMTTTIESGFGSLQFVNGYLLNNELTDFSFSPTDENGNPIANRVEPGKRPRSSMAPTIVLNDSSDEIEMVIGSPGGSQIIQYVTKTLIGVIDWDLDIQQAINLPNFGASNSTNVRVEEGSVDVELIKAGLEGLGHTVDDTRAATSGLQGFVFNGLREDGSEGLLSSHPGSGTWAGGADPRREGIAMGTP
ncbi:gamma-glutamyltransferase [Granulosicoccus antarcticus]|nr:gamma-glutamyltransferase [Granulosicoccus antarcticus]